MLITNREVLEVNKRGKNGHQVPERGNVRVWKADGVRPGERYLALFILGEASEDVRLAWSELGVSGTVLDVRDLWTHQSAVVANGIHRGVASSRQRFVSGRSC